jgi:hypothetical protein
MLVVMRLVPVVALACLGVASCEYSYTPPGSVPAEPEQPSAPPAKPVAPEVVALREPVFAAAEPLVLGGVFDGIERLVWSTMESQPMDRPPVRSVDLAERAR